MKKSELTFKRNRVGQVQIFNTGIQRPGGEAKKNPVKTRTYRPCGVSSCSPCVHMGFSRISSILQPLENMLEGL